MWYHWKGGNGAASLEFWFQASAIYSTLYLFHLMYVQNYFGNWVDVETIKIDDELLSVDQWRLEVLVQGSPWIDDGIHWGVL
jgi:hypothetical protein